ncbi:MAG: Asp-tRNA(Asn)/Glu-tRNA(Gln) amidotransferase subunit GatB [Rickettsiales bacterium]|jgi:aspartyl-tRNA(Asn)/glutamyl-tRNA(Gln) amidotransferase subunit B|nr:Asp-tRNA(Asn)/Glu-tRNA(Gln) amidotransferase subunit GatB [Rickettsiales bacterium]
MPYIVDRENSKWEVVVGLEVHCQLKTQSKLFSRSSAEFGAEPNNHVSFFDCAMPGQLPVMNRFALEQAIKTGIGLNAEFNLVSTFDRKNYFYADLPSGYQITQFFLPIIKSGWLEIEDETKKRIRIREAHLEQDAGKSIHDQSPVYSLIDLNRAGVTLLEIVSEPDMRSPGEAMEYLRKLRALLRSIETCDGNMDEGSMRCDANVSVRTVGNDVYGTRCEIKNINSIKNVGLAIEYEARRQVELIEAGDTVSQETRKYEAESGITKTMRSKEDSIDYRYFPEPDLAPVIISRELIDEIGRLMPEMPEAKKARYITDYSLTEYDVKVLTSTREMSEYFEELVSSHDPKLSANWLTTELMGRLNRLGLPIEQSPVGTGDLSELLGLIENGTISGKIAKDVLDNMLETGKTAGTIVEENGLRQIVNVDDVNKIIDRVLAENPKQLEQYRSGNERIFGFFVGQLMKLSDGRVNPQMANDLLREKLTK